MSKNPVTEAQGFITDHLLSDEQRVILLGFTEEHGQLGEDIELDRAARIMRALLAESYLLRREITESHDPQWMHRGAGGWWVRCTCDAAVPVGRHGDAEPDIAEQRAAIDRHVAQILLDIAALPTTTSPKDPA